MNGTYSNVKFVELINEYVHSERDRDIIIDRFVHGLLIKELSTKYNLCDRQIHRILKKADIFLIQLS